jgi:hypothetical protein
LTLASRHSPRSPRSPRSPMVSASSPLAASAKPSAR